MAEPPVAVFDSGTRQWRYESEYPLARTDWTKLYLSGEGLGRTAPTGTAAPLSQHTRCRTSPPQLAAGKPALAYTTEPSAEKLTINGPISLTFFASSSQIDTAWFVKLADIQPDGTARNLSRGILKASFRKLDPARSHPGRPFHPFLEQELLEPGKIYEYQIELRPVFHTIKPGHRLQLQISSEDIQYTNPLPPRSTCVAVAVANTVENTIHADVAHPSHLLLPVIPDAPEIAPVASPVADINWPLTPGSWAPNTDGWPLTGD